MVGGAIMKNKWIIFIAIILIFVTINVNHVTNFDEVDTAEVYNTNWRKEDIRTKWHQCKPQFNGDPYLEEPMASYPYRLGKLEPDFIEDGVNMANFVRYLAGLPDDLEADPILNDQAQYGAVLLAANETLTHEPSRPDDMNKSFYDVGYKTAMRSNIASGIYSLSDAVIAYMMDFGDLNLTNIGHRRWILNPQMKTIGFGYCDGYSTMKVLHQDRREELDYDYISYPAEGNFPSVIFYGSCFAYGSNPWSVILNPKKYDNERLSEIRVELKDLNSLTIWRFCPKDTKSDCEKYFKVDTSSCGVPFCIIFRPDNIYDYKSGSRYQVTVTGLYTVEEEETAIEYIVNFFDL